MTTTSTTGGLFVNTQSNGNNDNDDNDSDKVQRLQEQIAQLTAQLNSLAGDNKSTTSITENSSLFQFPPPLSQQQQPKRRRHPLMPHATTVYYESKASGKTALKQHRERLGRNASIATRQVLNALPHDTSHSNTQEQIDSFHPLTQRIVSMFRDPASHLDYLSSAQFSKDVLKLCGRVRKLLEKEPRVVFVQSPAYVFGDIHGNLEDLHFFSDNIWRLGMSLTAGNFCFLGDYVDRGMSCLECVAYLFAMKLSCPHKVFLLRGNHETRDVNGWEEHYGERSFMYQCRSRFGDHLGYKIWEQCNQVFDRMPLAAVIDQDIFCVHGGIPRPISSLTQEHQQSIKDILNVSRVAGINPPYAHEDEMYQQVASDCIWSDPASEEQEITSVDPESGFGESLRGGGAICFGHKAVSNFLQQQGLSYIMRAHEAHAEGVAVSKGARVFTVFSTSKDHNQGSQAMAGCILVDFDKLQVINRSPAYKNQYVHRRDSVSLASLSEAEIQQRIRLGLIVSNSPKSDDEEEEEEEWDDIEGDDSDGDDNDNDGATHKKDDGFVFATGRRSSVDPSHTCTSPVGSTHDSHELMHRSENSDHLAMEFDDSNSSFAPGRFLSINEEDEEEAAASQEEEADELETVGSDDEAMAW